MARILLIEDDHAVRTMLCLMLAHFGHTVIEACNGNEGLALFPQTNPDVVITDLVMPEKNGIEVIQELRKKSPPVKIIAMSGGEQYDAGVNLETAQIMGAAKVLAKPFPHEVLIAVISDLVPTNSAVPPMGT